MLQRPHAPHGENPGRCSSENTELLFKTMCRKKEKNKNASKCFATSSCGTSWSLMWRFIPVLL